MVKKNFCIYLYFYLYNNFKSLNSLHSSNIKDDGLKVIANALVNLKHFKSLDIGDCKLTDECVNHVREIVHRREHQNGKKSYYKVYL